MQNLHTHDQNTQQSSIIPASQKRRNGRRNAPEAPLHPEVVEVIERIVRRQYVDPNADAFSIEAFCARYGIGRQLAYDEINAGRLVAKKPGDSRRTLIRRVDAERWLDASPNVKPKLAPHQ